MIPHCRQITYAENGRFDLESVAKTGSDSGNISNRLHPENCTFLVNRLMPSSAKTKTPDFEKLLGELDKIVQRMESGDQSLDQAMKDFERGMELSEECQKSLDSAQQRVDKLVQKHDRYQLEAVEQQVESSGYDLDDDPTE